MVSVRFSEDKDDPGFHIVNDNHDEITQPPESFVTPSGSLDQ